MENPVVLTIQNSAAGRARLKQLWLKASGQTGHRRQDDRSIRAVMVYAALASLAANSLLAYVVFKMDLLRPLFELMQKNPHIEDRLTVMGFGVLFSVLFLTLFYTARVTMLLNDVKRLAAERDKAVERKNQHMRLESLGVMVAGISHEINNSLQVMLSSCEQAKALAHNPEESVKLIENAIENGMHAKRVTSNVLVFAKQGGALSVKRVELGGIVEEAVEFSRAFLPNTVDVKPLVTEPGMGLSVDRSAFIQVMSNLISNAAHAMGFLGTVQVLASRVKLTGAEAKPLRLNAGSYAKIDVVDHGQGISPEHLARIFDPFFSTKGAGEGSGLGLSIVHGLVQGMRGSITVTSEVGKETRFTLLFPEVKEN